jgi:hypothetical protein
VLKATPPLPIELRLDPTATPSRLGETLAALLLARARLEVERRRHEDDQSPATVPGTTTPGGNPGVVVAPERRHPE